jgi:tetratricopeptide (TPR) repeat protein
MADFPRIEELKRRVQQDPASIAFAALADEYRRAGLFNEAIETCRAGLLRHPAYLSARVTLGRALLETGHFDEAEIELEQVVRSAPENLAAIRALAEIHRRRGEIPETSPGPPPEPLMKPPAAADNVTTAVAAPQPAPLPVSTLAAAAPTEQPAVRSDPALPRLELFLAAVLRARLELDSSRANS